MNFEIMRQEKVAWKLQSVAILFSNSGKCKCDSQKFHFHSEVFKFGNTFTSEFRENEVAQDKCMWVVKFFSSTL